MKALIFVMGLWATIALAQFDLSTLRPVGPIPDHKASGFGGYGFGSSRDFVRTGRAHDRHILDREYADWIWYIGTIRGCGFESGYQFGKRDKLIGGLWVIRNDDECYQKVQAYLIDAYGNEHMSIEIRGTKIVAEMWIPHTRIVHRKSATDHTVSFYDTFGDTRIGGR
jgi:hypothetical protein